MQRTSPSHNTKSRPHCSKALCWDFHRCAFEGPFPALLIHMCILPMAVYTHDPLYHRVPTLRARDIRLAINSPREKGKGKTELLLFPHGAAREVSLWAVKGTCLIVDLRHIDRAGYSNAGVSSDLVSLLPTKAYSFDIITSRRCDSRS